MEEFSKLNDLNIIILLFLIFLINQIILNYREKIASNFKLYDFPNNRKIHKKPTPLIGGICLFATIIVAYFLSLIYREINLQNFITSIVFFIIFFLTGLIDDIKQISAKKRTFIILFTLLILLFSNDNFVIENLSFKFSNLEIQLGKFSLVFTIFSIFALYNAFNFIDGYNGVSISIVIFWILFLFFSNPNIIYLFTLVILITLFFYNLAGKIFLGNSGTSLLSVFFSVSLIGDYNLNNYIYADEILFIL